jgi:SPP1 gp7 family putative phage head morphogenesis protein
MAFRSPKAKRAWANARKAESRYGIALRKLAAMVSAIVDGFPKTNAPDLEPLHRALAQYAVTMGPWAEAVARRMLTEVSLRDAQAWEQHARSMGRSIKKEIEGAPTGAVMRQLMDEQVTLIKSIPLEAAQKAQELATSTLSTGARFEDLVKEIEGLGAKTRARATLIARTEVGRASSNLTQARAQYIGSEGYIWRTVGDPDVRPSHKRMNGKFVRWDSPPVVDEGLAPYHAGCVFNCRCYAEPVIPD